MKSDIEIAQSTVLRPINDIVRQLGIDPEKTEGYGKYIAKVDISAIKEEAVRKHHLILVTAISPTKAGIGKTTVSVGLALGMNAIGKNAVVALREPSLGPCFGQKAVPPAVAMHKYCRWTRSISTSRATSMPSPQLII